MTVEQELCLKPQTVEVLQQPVLKWQWQAVKTTAEEHKM